MAGSTDQSRVVYAGQIVDQLVSALTEGERGLESIPSLMRVVLTDGLWKERRVKGSRVVTHARFIDFITSPPIDGLGEKPELIKRLLRDDPATLAAFETAVVEGNQGRRNDIRSNPTDVPADRGKAYTLRRLERDHPELFAEVVGGSMSANEAAIKAGFRKVPSVADLLRKAWEKASKDERQAFLDWACQQGV